MYGNGKDADEEARQRIYSVSKGWAENREDGWLVQTYCWILVSQTAGVGKTKTKATKETAKSPIIPLSK